MKFIAFSLIISTSLFALEGPIRELINQALDEATYVSVPGRCPEESRSDPTIIATAYPTLDVTAHVLCIQEIPDCLAAGELIEILRPCYAHLYFDPQMLTLIATRSKVHLNSGFDFLIIGPDEPLAHVYFAGDPDQIFLNSLSPFEPLLHLLVSESSDLPATPCDRLYVVPTPFLPDEAIPHLNNSLALHPFLPWGTLSILASGRARTEASVSTDGDWEASAELVYEGNENGVSVGGRVSVSGSDRNDVRGEATIYGEKRW